MSPLAAPTIIGRYVLHAPLARGGLATIHLARLLGAAGFSRMVAAKRLHPELAEETVRNIVEQHRGQITVGRSDLGGAAFRVLLPIV